MAWHGSAWCMPASWAFTQTLSELTAPVTHTTAQEPDPGLIDVPSSDAPADRAMQTPCRARILEVILKGENKCAGFKAEELAAMTDGYSGSDLKNLCTSAAYRPVRSVKLQQSSDWRCSRQ